MKKSLRIVCAFMLLVATAAHAGDYSKKESASAGNQFAGVPQFQICILGSSGMACGVPAPYSTSFTSHSAMTTLTATMGCVYQYSRNASAGGTGFDTYNCPDSSKLPGYTFIIKVDGDAANANVTLILGLYNSF